MKNKTINKCSIFPPEIEAILVKNNIVNWVGGEWANLDIIFTKIIDIAKDYIDIEKVDKLYKDVYRLHFLHDLVFSSCSSKIEFYFANYIFVRDLWKLIHWLPWYKRFAIKSIIFILLNRYWKKYSRHYKLK